MKITCDKCKNYTHWNKGIVTRHRNKCGEKKKPNDSTDQSVKSQNSKQGKTELSIEGILRAIPENTSPENTCDGVDSSLEISDQNGFRRDGSCKIPENRITGSDSKNGASSFILPINQKKCNKTKSRDIASLSTENVLENISAPNTVSSSSQEIFNQGSTQSDGSGKTYDTQNHSKNSDSSSIGQNTKSEDLRPTLVTDQTIIEIKVKKGETPNSTIVTHHRRFRSEQQKNALINGLGKIGLKMNNSVDPWFVTFVQR